MLLTNVQIVSAALQSLHKDGGEFSNREEIKQRIYELDEKVGGKLLENTSMSEIMKRGVLGKVPYHMFIERKIIVPLNVRFWLDGCQEPKSLFGAKRYLSNQNNPLYGYIWPIMGSMFLSAFSLKKGTNAERSVKSSVRYTLDVAEKDLLDKNEAVKRVQDIGESISDYIKKLI